MVQRTIQTRFNNQTEKLAAVKATEYIGTSILK